MKYDLTALPLGSASRAKAQLANLDLLKALTTCRFGGLALDSLQPDLTDCLERLYSKSPGVILSGYYVAGNIGPFSIDQLLRRLYEKKDFPTFLKQAYRFNVYSGLKEEVDAALKWNSDRELPDAMAWQRKFGKLQEQEILRLDSPPPTVRIADDVPDDSREVPRVFELRPLAVRDIRQDRRSSGELNDDPYIISHTARAKMEQANDTHRHTLQTLRTHLGEQGRAVGESKLIDAYAVLADGPAIFEVKSISESNERDQIRHALSQLYEYRFLYSMSDASLWVVFSQAPSSQWYIDYLADDRGIRVVWIDGGALKGPSIHLLK